MILSALVPFATIPLSVISPLCGGFNEKHRHIPSSGSRGKVAVAVVVLLVVVVVVVAVVVAVVAVVVAVLYY